MVSVCVYKKDGKSCVVVDTQICISIEFKCTVESGPIKLFPKLEAQDPVSLSVPSLESRDIRKQGPSSNNGSQEDLAYDSGLPLFNSTFLFSNQTNAFKVVCNRVYVPVMGSTQSGKDYSPKKEKCSHTEVCD